MKIGYARVSTDDQHLDLQLAALGEAGCRRIFQEKVSGARRDRPELARLLDHLPPEAAHRALIGQRKNPARVCTNHSGSSSQG